ncbi:MAG TPA: hypothetical protein PKW35_00750, partial [Nannocystaceae bacterium]|nr:hypothetical protein [Nannocystaceae bacterium]
AEAEAAEAEPPVRPGRHFVFANTYGFTFGVSPLPSFEAMFFFGGALRQREEGRRRWAIGYQPTISFGLADRYFIGILTLRHHVAAHSFGGKRERLVASVSAGVASVALLEPAIVEGEGRMGYLFGRRRDRSRMVGVVGGLLRLGWHFRTFERVPMPQVGVFVGMLLR